MNKRAINTITRTSLLLLLCAGNMYLLNVMIYLRKKIKRRWWVHPFYRERTQVGAFEKTFIKYKNNDHEKFFKLTRMTPDQFDELLRMISFHLQKNSYREYLTPQFRLAFTIW